MRFRKISSTRLFVFLILIVVAITACKRDKAEKNPALQELYKTYKDGAIDECTHNSEPCYSASLNAYDVPTVIYNNEGKKIGECNFAWGHPDSICYQLQSCSVIYRCRNHISGQPFVDTYGLSQ